MTGASTWAILNRLTQGAMLLGLKLVPSKYGEDKLALIVDTGLPTFSRNMELASGTAEYLSGVMRGWDISARYLISLGLVNSDKIANAEEKVIQQQVIDVLKGNTVT